MGVKRVKTGIEGFDKLVQGGFPEGSCILMVGTPGTGKTIFSLEYLYNGALKFKEKGLYISVGQPVDSLIEQAKLFGWKIEKLINNGMLEIIYISTKDLDQNISQFIVDKIHQNNIKRAVIDSTTSIGFTINDVAKFRVELLKISTTMEILGLTSLLTCEVLEGSNAISRFGVEQFVTEGTIVLYYNKIENTRVRSLEIYKMRGTNHSRKIHPFEITENGIVVYSKEEVFGY